MHRGFGVLLIAVLAGGCGGGHDRIDKGVAERLARQADAIAVSLERGDGCSAARRVQELRGQARAAIVRGEIPMRLRAPLRASLGSLAGRVVCRPRAVVPPPPPEPDDEDGHDHGKGKGHGNGHGKGKR